MKFYFRKKPKGTSFTFTQQDALMTDELAKEMRLEAAFRRIARRLFKQYENAETREGKQRVVGIEIHGVSFTFLLDDKKE